MQLPSGRMEWIFTSYLGAAGVVFLGMVFSSFTRFPAQLTGVVEHLLDALGQGGEHRFPEQGIQPCEEQSAQNNSNQDFDRGVNVAFPAAPGKDAAGFGGGNDRLDFQLANEMFHGISPLFKMVGHRVGDVAFVIQ